MSYRRHGTYSKYQHDHCRCEACREANRLYQVDWRWRRDHPDDDTTAIRELARLPVALEEINGEWRRRAGCRDHPDPNIFFPDQGEPATEARKVCAACPVRVECLDYALRSKQRHGVWGGRSERERRRILRAA